MSNLFSETDLIDDLLDEESDTFYEEASIKNIQQDIEAVDKFECNFKLECGAHCAECMLEYDCSACANNGSIICNFCTHAFNG